MKTDPKPAVTLAVSIIKVASTDHGAHMLDGMVHGRDGSKFSDRITDIDSTIIAHIAAKNSRHIPGRGNRSSWEEADMVASNYTASLNL